jgi:hypothetical protein
MEKEKKTRRDKGQPRWTTRDVWLLRWIAAMYAVRVDQLQELLSLRPLGKTQEEGWLAEATVRHWIERWRRAGILGHGVILAGKPGFVWLTRKGLRTLELPYRPWVPNPGRLRHLFYVNEIRLLYEEDECKPVWVSERQLDSERGPRRRGERVGHLPDGELHWSDGGVTAIEVELSTKVDARLEDILRQLALNYSRAWYYVWPRMKPLLEEAVASLPTYTADIHEQFSVIGELDTADW